MPSLKNIIYVDFKIKPEDRQKKLAKELAPGVQLMHMEEVIEKGRLTPVDFTPPKANRSAYPTQHPTEQHTAPSSIRSTQHTSSTRSLPPAQLVRNTSIQSPDFRNERCGIASKDTRGIASKEAKIEEVWGAKKAKRARGSKPSSPPRAPKTSSPTCSQSARSPTQHTLLLHASSEEVSS